MYEEAVTTILNAHPVYKVLSKLGEQIILCAL
jgi:hypothetical protein